GAVGAGWAEGPVPAAPVSAGPAPSLWKGGLSEDERCRLSEYEARVRRAGAPRAGSLTEFLVTRAGGESERSASRPAPQPFVPSLRRYVGALCPVIAALTKVRGRPC